MVKIAFYKAEKGKLLDKIIAWWTRPNFFKFWESGKYSHVEIVFCDKRNICFSTSPRENKTRWKYIDDLYTSGKWDFLEVKYTDKTFENYLIFNCNKEEGKPYDWLCIFLTNIIPLNIENPKKWMCSELVAKLVYNLKHSNTYTPNKLYDYINKINEK